MQTGEGKTLTAVLPLYLNALTGKPVHLVTVNDYLAQRDCEWVGTIFRWLGLTTAALTNRRPQKSAKRSMPADVVYGTASEFGFDYLRDNSMAISKDEQVQRGYYFAIIDEVDSILIDEARTPLIISGPVPVSRQMYDELKERSSELVRVQRDLVQPLGRRCAQSAGEAWKQLAGKKDKEQRARSRKRHSANSGLSAKARPENKILKRLKENPDMRAALDKWDLYYYGEQNKEENGKLFPSSTCHRSTRAMSLN